MRYLIASIGVIAAFGVAICSAAPVLSTPGSSSSTPTPAARAGSSALKPIDQAVLRSTVAATAKELLISGAVVLLDTPQGRFDVNYGTSKLGASDPPSANTHFRIASNTKTITAAIILQLAQEGKLSLDDSASQYVAGVPNGDKITIAELLEMRSGLYNYTSAPELSATIDKDPTKAWTSEELLAIAFKRPPNAPPNKEFEYDNTNYALLGLIVEKVDGKPLRAAMHDRLFAPLGMTNTMLPVSTSHALPNPFSHGYLYGSSSVALVGEPPYSPDFIAKAKAGTVLPKDYTDLNHSFAAAAGGVVSTATDLAIWIRALTTGRVLNAEYQHRWLESLQLEDPKKPDGQRYGYGIAQMRWGPNAYYFHGAETPGYNSFIGYDPTNKVTLIVWTNLTVSLDQTPTANAIMLKMLDQIYVVSRMQPAATKTPRSQ